MTAHPHGKGVAVTATLKNPAHTAWFGNTAITPWANVQGDPGSTRYTVTHGTLTLTATNLAGPNALHDPTVNYAWPQEAGVGLSSPAARLACGAEAYLSTTHGTLNSSPLYVTIKQRLGAIAVQDAPLAVGGSWRISVAATSAGGGVQRQARTLTAQKGHYLGAVYRIATTFTGFTNLSDFTSLTITAAKTDGTHTSRVTLSRTP